MFKISRRQTIFRASLLGCFVVAILSTTAYFIINQHKDTNAATIDGEEVRVSYDDGEDKKIRYGTGTGSRYSTYTRRYNVTNGAGETYDALCAQPRQSDPSNDKYEATLLTGNGQYENRYAIKVFLYAWKYGNDSVRNTVFGDIVNDENWGTSEGNRRLTFAHAAIGYIYGGSEDTTGLSSNEIKQVKKRIGIVKQLVADSDPIWQAASAYNLYRTKAENAQDKNKQDVVWLEPTGSIIVRKRDAETQLFGPQGNGSFDGITFTLSDGSTTVSQTLSNGATSVTFTNLNLNKKYTISESGGNNSYSFIPEIGNITPTITGTEVVFDNTIKKGRLTVNKIDKDTGTCTNSSGLSFAGTTFQLINTSINSIYYNGTTFASGSVIATKTLADGECSFAFDNLPYGTYSIQETAVSAGYTLDSTPRSITIPNPADNNYDVTYTFENQPIRGDITFLKKDTNNNTPMANAVFEISSISDNYQENHIVIADANGVVDTRASVNPHTNNTNGYDEIYYASEAPMIYAGQGTWFGKDKNGNPTSARDDVGALPYGTYLIQELKCDANMFCTNINNEKKTFSITTNGQVVNLNDANSDSWGNNCAEFSLSTTATDNSDGDHYIKAGQEAAVIKDVVAYCAKTGYTFTIKGTLMDKATNQPLLINGEPVEQSVEISPKDNDCGTVEMLFPINSSELAGKSIVVFEKLYYKNELKASHEDINDVSQTVDIISLGTIATDNSDDDKLIVPSEETVIKDTVSYCAAAGQHYTIIGTLIDKITQEPILVNGEPVTESASFVATQNCGVVDITFPAIDTTTIAGHPIVVYETLYKVIPGEPDTLEPVISHEDPNDEDQTVYIIDLYTTVKPNEDGTKVFPRDTDITVTDTVHYCLQPGLEYTVKGIVMDRDTGNGLLVNSNPVEQTATFTPTETCGNLDMTYSFNTTDLGGARLVIFESLYYNGELLIEHKDINNELEAFEIDINVPETGFVTRNHNGGQASSHQEFIIIAIIATVPVIAYAFNRYRVRKSFLKR